LQLDSTTCFVKKTIIEAAEKMQLSTTEWCKIVQGVSINDDNDDDDVFVRSWL